MTGLRIEYMPLSTLRKWPRNPRRHAVDALQRSMTRFGYNQPVLIDERTQTLVSGHGRLEALEALRASGSPPPAHILVEGDEWLVPVVRGVEFISETDMEAYAIADNRLVELGGWDEEKLAEVLSDLARAGALQEAGYAPDELDALLRTIGGEEAEEQGAYGGPYSADQIIEAAFRYYREHGFPYPRLPVHECMYEINMLARNDTETLRHTIAGMRVADSYHPQRFRARNQNFPTPFETFANDVGLRKALGLVMAELGHISEGTLLSTLGWTTVPGTAGTQACANFRPGFALHMYRRFLPEGGVLLDTSMGYGGRLVGFLASKGRLYIGIDPAEEQFRGNLRLAQDLMAEDRVELYQLPAEDVPHHQVAGRCDFAFTSPPYFAQEKYSDEPTQSYIRYPEVNAWYRGFLVPTMALQFAALKPGRLAAVVVDNIKHKGKLIPLIDMTAQAGREVGFELVGEDVYPIHQRPGEHVKVGREAHERVLIFRKPEALE